MENAKPGAAAKGETAKARVSAARASMGRPAVTRKRIIAAREGGDEAQQRAAAEEKGRQAEAAAVDEGERELLRLAIVCIALGAKVASLPVGMDKRRIESELLADQP